MTHGGLWPELSAPRAGQPIATVSAQSLHTKPRLASKDASLKFRLWHIDQ